MFYRRAVGRLGEYRVYGSRLSFSHGTEILTLRHTNTSREYHRSVFVVSGLTRANLAQIGIEQISFPRAWY